MRILIADGRHNVRWVISEILVYLHHEVITPIKIDDLLRIAREEAFDVIVVPSDELFFRENSHGKEAVNVIAQQQLGFPDRKLHIVTLDEAEKIEGACRVEENLTLHEMKDPLKVLSHGAYTEIFSKFEAVMRDCEVTAITGEVQV